MQKNYIKIPLNTKSIKPQAFLLIAKSLLSPYINLPVIVCRYAIDIFRHRRLVHTRLDRTSVVPSDWILGQWRILVLGCWVVLVFSMAHLYLHVLYFPKATHNRSGLEPNRLDHSSNIGHARCTT
jgi:hypothetical protein